MSAAALLAALSAICAVLAAWEAIAAAEQQRLVQALRRWVAPALELVRSGRAPTSPERRRLALLGALALLGGGWLVGGLLAGVALAAAAPWAARRVVHARARRRAAAVAAGVPAIARALADALAGGRSVRGAVTAVARDGGVGGPAGEELRAAAAALDLGKRTEDVLRDLARRSEGGPLDTLVAAVLLQRDAGGDLAALLRDLAAALE
ncbi:MAG TPA: type II secretion system F family protein, partial [Solirubrobacteraceae bacterium]|nr:type II secretion system F family protein [Solirubrobacteraceae bacterium]